MSFLDKVTEGAGALKNKAGQGAGALKDKAGKIVDSAREKLPGKGGDEGSKTIAVDLMPEELKQSYLKILIWVTYADDNEIDPVELAQLQLLMTRLNFSQESRFATRQTINSPDTIDLDEQFEVLRDKVPSESREALPCSLLKEAIALLRKTGEKTAHESSRAKKLAKAMWVTDDQVKILEEACITEEKIISGELSDNEIVSSLKGVASQAAAVGIPVAAIYLSGSVVGLSAAGLTSGLAALGLGGVLGLSSMVTGIGAVVLLGVGVYKGVKWVTSGSAEEKRSQLRDMMLQQIIANHQKSISELGQDVGKLAEQAMELLVSKETNEARINKLSKEITLFSRALYQLREQAAPYEEEVAQMGQA